MLTHNVTDATAYTLQSNHVSISLEITEEPTEQSLDHYSVKHISIDFVNLLGEICYTIDISLLNTQYGVFISYINDECLVDAFAKWLHDNQYISAIAYDQYVADKHRADVTIVPNGAITFSTMATSSTLANTMYTSINITATNSGASLTISGYVYWRDSNGNSHPARGIDVDICDKEILGYSALVSCVTNSNGYFYATVANDTSILENGGYDISVTINARNQYATMILDNSANQSSVVLYYFTVDCGDNIATSRSVFGTYDESDNACIAFMMLDAIYTGSQYVKSMSGTTPDPIVVTYPYSGLLVSHYNTLYQRIYLDYNARNSWDTVLHEYGHYVAETYGIFPGIAIAHAMDENAIVYMCTNGLWSLPSSIFSSVKKDACALAWQEGWVTYFSVAAQVQQNTQSMSINGVGDILYGSFNLDTGYTSYNSGKGEASELAISRVLWDLTDSSTILGTTDDDAISWGFYVVWDYTVDSDADTFSDFMNYLETCAPYSANASYVSQILEKEQISANLQYPIISSSEAKIYWSKAYEDGTYVFNRYYLDVYDSDKILIYTTQVFSSPGVLNGATWSELCGDNPDGLYLCIRTVPYNNVPGYSQTYASGPYCSELVFYAP